MKLRAIALLSLLALTCGGRREQSVAPDVLYRQGRTALWRGDFEQAELIGRQGAERSSGNAQWRELFSILCAEAMGRRGDKNALATLDATPVSGTRETAVRRLMAHGYILGTRGENDAAACDFVKAAALAPRNDIALRAEIAMFSISPPFRKGEWDEAELCARQAIDLGRASNATPVLANALGMLGTAESNRREFRQALEHLDEGLRLSRMAGMKSTESLIVGNLGWCYMQLGDTDEASRSYREALDYAIRHDITRTQPTWLTNLSNVYLTKQQFDDALPYAERAVAAARRNGDQAKLAAAFGNLALINLELGRTGVAATLTRDALALRETYDPPLVPYSRLTQARIEAATGSAASAVAELESIAAAAGKDPELRWQAQAAAASAYKNLGRLDDAERMYEAALDTGDQARAQMEEEPYLFAFESNLIRFYDEYIDLLLVQGRVADALRVAERSRARTLLQGIDLPPKPRVAPTELARATHATILSYWLAPRRSLLWVVTERGIEVEALPPAATIERDVDAYRTELQSLRHTLKSQRGAALYAMLVAPAKVPPSSRVIVIPDGRLNALNLETVIAPSPKPHYWIDDVTVSYTPSLQLLAPTTPWRGARDGRLLVFGNVPAEGREFRELRRAGIEISDVSQHFEREKRVVVTGTAATPAAYAAMNLQQFDFLHFTAHGTASVRSPLESAVILAPGAGGFRLSGSEIVHLPLAAQLVTVSSCNSAGQRSYAGEGLVGLAWAFLRAGAQRVVAAQWDVDDSATPGLMDLMYGALQDGREPADALRDAKRALLHSKTIYDRPLYWAPFVLYGSV